MKGAEIPAFDRAARHGAGFIFFTTDGATITGNRNSSAASQSTSQMLNTYYAGYTFTTPPASAPFGNLGRNAGRTGAARRHSQAAGAPGCAARFWKYESAICANWSANAIFLVRPGVTMSQKIPRKNVPL